MKIFGRVKDYFGKVAALAGSFIGDGYTNEKLSAERNIEKKRIDVPLVAVRYDHIGGIDALLKAKFSLVKDSEVLINALDDVKIHAERYVGSLGSKSLDYLIDGFSQKAGTIREAYKITDKLGAKANDLARKFDDVAISLERAALDYDLRLVRNGLTGDMDDVIRSLANIADNAKRYVELFDEPKLEKFVSRIKDDAALILKACENNIEAARPLVDMYHGAALSLISAQFEKKEDECKQIGSLDLDLSLVDKSNILDHSLI